MSAHKAFDLRPASEQEAGIFYAQAPELDDKTGIMPKRGENRERFRKDRHSTNTSSITNVTPGV
jgi:hypothetical protein